MTTEEMELEPEPEPPVEFKPRGGRLKGSKNKIKDDESDLEER